MSFSTTKIDDLKVGTFVKLTATAAAMRSNNNYQGGSDLGDVKSVNRNSGTQFRLNGDSEIAGWLKPEFVEVVTGSEFDSDIDLDGDELICTETEYSYWTVGETYTVSRHGDDDDFCSCGCTDEDELGLVDGDGDFDTSPSAEFINITRIKRETTEPSVTTAVAVVEVAPEPTKDPLTPFGELSDTDKAELLLAKHEGKMIQIYYPWANRWSIVGAPNWTTNTVYRVEPSEITAERVKQQELSKALQDSIDKLNDLNKAA